MAWRSRAIDSSWVAMMTGVDLRNASAGRRNARSTEAA